MKKVFKIFSKDYSNHWFIISMKNDVSQETIDKEIQKYLSYNFKVIKYNNQ